MLTCFQVVGHFNKLRVALWVDCEHRQAEMTVTYERRIKRAREKVAFHEVETPAEAERWLSRPCGLHGSFVETLEWMARSGNLHPNAAAEDMRRERLNAA